MPPEYHMDLPLKGDADNILDVGKDCKSKGFLAHLFLFITVISLSSYRAIEVGSKYHSPGTILKKDRKKCSLAFGNILISLQIHSTSLYFLLHRMKCLGSPFQLGTQRNLLIYNAVNHIYICMTKTVTNISYIDAFVQEIYTYEIESFKVQVCIRVSVMII